MSVPDAVANTATRQVNSHEKKYGAFPERDIDIPAIHKCMYCDHKRQPEKADPETSAFKFLKIQFLHFIQIIILKPFHHSPPFRDAKLTVIDSTVWFSAIFLPK